MSWDMAGWCSRAALPILPPMPPFATNGLKYDPLFPREGCAAMPNPVTLDREGEIAIITIDSPPVNALSHAVRAGILAAIEEADADAGIDAILIRCAGRTFVAGADITEFGKPPREPMLGTVIERIEQAQKPVVAAIHGTALGGGFELTLGCHYRVALASAKA